MSKFIKYIIENDDQWKQLRSELSSKCKPFIKEIRPIGRLLYRGSNRLITDYHIFKSRLDNRNPLDTKRIIHDELNYWFERKFGWKVRNGVFVSANYKTAENYGNYCYIFFPIGKYEYVFSYNVTDIYVWVMYHKLFAEGELEEIYEKERAKGMLNIYTIDGERVDYKDIFYLTDLEPPEKEGEYTVKAIRPYKSIKEGDYFTFTFRRMSFDEWFNKYHLDAHTTKSIVDLYQNDDLKMGMREKSEISFNCKEYYLINTKYTANLLDLIKYG